MISDIISRIKDEKTESIESEEYWNAIDIVAMSHVNLGHQVWNSYGGVLLACLHTSREAKHTDVEIVQNPNTNYFPIESIAERFKFKTKAFAQGITISKGRTMCMNTTRPRYKLLGSFFKSYYQRIAIKDDHGNKNKAGTETIIFAIKAGSKNFSRTDFHTEDAIEITIELIKRLAEKTKDKYSFVIDGISAPYIQEGQRLPREEPVQRKRFRENEELWFKKLREGLPENKLIFINGMNLIEKYTFYKSASKFVRFGRGSYELIWLTLKNSTPMNHFAVFYKKKGEARANIENQNLGREFVLTPGEKEALINELKEAITRG